MRVPCTCDLPPHGEGMIDNNAVAALVRDGEQPEDAHQQTLNDLSVIQALSRRTFPDATSKLYDDEYTHEAALEQFVNPDDQFGTTQKKVDAALASVQSRPASEAQPSSYLLSARVRLDAMRREFAATINYAYHVDGQSLAAIAEATGKGRSTIADIVKKQTHVGPVLVARRGGADA